MKLDINWPAYDFDALKRAATSGPYYGDPVRPERLPRPRCRVMLVCGPPAAGKTTYVKEHASAADTVIDLDLIAKEFGLGRNRPGEATGLLLAERNARLARLARQNPEHVAWVVINAPSTRLRAWWCERLDVAAQDVVLLVPSRPELLERIHRDPERKGLVELHARLVDDWFIREQQNTTRLVRGIDASGWPTDPLHHWNDRDADEIEADEFQIKPPRRRLFIKEPNRRC